MVLYCECYCDLSHVYLLNRSFIHKSLMASRNTPTYIVIAQNRIPIYFMSICYLLQDMQNRMNMTHSVVLKWWVLLVSKTCWHLIEHLISNPFVVVLFEKFNPTVYTRTPDIGTNCRPIATTEAVNKYDIGITFSILQWFLKKIWFHM